MESTSMVLNLEEADNIPKEAQGRDDKQRRKRRFGSSFRTVSKARKKKRHGGAKDAAAAPKEAPASGAAVEEGGEQDLLTASVSKMLAMDQKYVSEGWQKGERKQIKAETVPVYPATQTKSPQTSLLSGLTGWESMQPVSADQASFASCGLGSKLCAVLKSELDAEQPTKTQSLLIPALLSGRDVVCGSGTGHGKTVGYVASIVEHLSTRRVRLTRADGTRVVVLCRDLQRCREVAEVFKALMTSACWWLTCSVFAGGDNRNHEKSRLRKGVTVMIATETRLLDHMENTSAFHSEQIEFFIVDGASQLLSSKRGGKIRRVNQLLQDSVRRFQKRRIQTVVCTSGDHKEMGFLCTSMLRSPASIGFSFEKTAERKWQARAEDGWDIEQTENEGN